MPAFAIAATLAVSNQAQRSPCAGARSGISSLQRPEHDAHTEFLGRRLRSFQRSTERFVSSQGVVCLHHPQRAESSAQQPERLSRRNLVLDVLAFASVYLPMAQSVHAAEVADPAPKKASPASVAPSSGQFTTVEDNYNGWSFDYPTGSGLIVTKQPEAYDKALPLTVKLDQRIICQVANFNKGITITVVMTPLKAKGPTSIADLGDPKGAATAILRDRNSIELKDGRTKVYNAVRPSR